MKKKKEEQQIAFEWIQTESLIPYARNARKHSPAQVAKVASSIREFGFLAPIVVAENNTIIAGHCRLLAAQKLKLENVPVVRASHLTDAQRRAYTLADNRLALDSEWDEEMLQVELVELKDLGVKIDVTGFSLDDIKSPFENGESGGGEKGITETEVPEDKMRIAQLLAVKEVSKYLRKVDEILHPEVTVGHAAIDFLNTKYKRESYPRKNSYAFCPRQFFTVGNDYAMSDLFELVLNEQAKLDRMTFDNERVKITKLMSYSLPRAGCRNPQDFPVELARDLIDEFCESGGHVLDPCHGWGGRCIGFLLSRSAAYYDGFDPSPVAHEALERIKTSLIPLCEEEKHVSVTLSPFEKADLKNMKYDFALTSPPYFDVEKYEGEEQSRVLYGTFEQWCQFFYKPMIESVSSHLKTGSVFCLQVGSQSYPLKEKGIEYASQVFLLLEETRLTDINRRGEFATEEEFSEIILVFRKHIPTSC